MNEAKIKAALHEHVKNLQRHYKALLKTFDPDSIHDFRLEYKKLRALVRFLNTNAEETNRLKMGGKLKKIYRNLGNIRNYQLHRERMEGLLHHLILPSPDGYFELIEVGQNEAKEIIKVSANDFSFAPLRQKMGKGSYQPVSATSKQSFIEQKKGEFLQLILLAYYTDEDLHSIRKILKDILYNKFLLSGQSQLLPGLFADWKYLDQFAAQLGDFHDLCIALDLASHQMIVVIDSKEEQSNLMFLHKQLQWGKHKLAAVIHQQLAAAKQSFQKEAAMELDYAQMF